MIGLLGRLLSGNGGMLSEPQITLVAQMGCDGLCVGSPGIRGAPTSGGVPLQRVCPEQIPCGRFAPASPSRSERDDWASAGVKGGFETRPYVAPSSRREGLEERRGCGDTVSRWWLDLV